MGRIMNDDAHARPTHDAPEPLYDVNIPTPTHAERARTLVAQICPWSRRVIPTARS
jgi:hypothetical protein